MSKRVAVGVCVLVIALACGFFLQRKSNTEAYHFFWDALQQYDISDTGTVHGSRFTISHGRVLHSDGLPESSQDLPALREAYRLTLAKRSPLFDLTGTDIDKLRGALGSLKGAVHQLALQQDTDQEALIEHLYPINFLSSLVESEMARRHYITTGNATDGDHYDRALDIVLTTGKSDIHDFNNSFETILGEEHKQVRFPGFGGTITTENMKKAIQAIMRGFTANAIHLHDRRSCLHGSISQCKADELSLPDVSFEENSPRVLLPNNITEIRNVSALGLGHPSIKTALAVALTESRCTKELDGKQFYTLSSEQTDPDADEMLRYLNTIYFSTFGSGASSTSAYVRSRYMIPYLYTNPTSSYRCPDLGADISAVRASELASQFAASHPTVSPAVGSLLHSSIITENDARHYIHDALKVAHMLSAEDRDDLIAIALTFEHRGAQLNDIVARIAHTISSDVALKKSGIPFDVSARTMFLTHSAFPTLFQSFNSSFGSIDTSIRETNSGDLANYLKGILDYEGVRTQMSRNDIIHMMQQFHTFESSAAGALEGKPE